MINVKIILDASDPHDAPNPYVYTLTDEILANHDDVEFKFGLDEFDRDEAVDIVHIMWPNDLLRIPLYRNQPSLIVKRLKQLKFNGCRIIATCHNLKAHIDEGSDVYEMVYSASDVIIHLGEYSYNLFVEQYPNAHHILSSHHVYDTVFDRIPSREDAILKLGLKSDAHYVLCMGAFRNNQEKNLVKSLAEKKSKEGVVFIAPSLYNQSLAKPARRHVFKYLKYLFTKKRNKSLICNIGFVADELVPYYYAVSDVALIHRPEILNSGNVYMGFLMGKVVVGPDTGNVGEILKKLGNPVFLQNDDQSISASLDKAISLSKTELGNSNRNFALSHLSTKIIAEEHYSVYKNVVK